MTLVEREGGVTVDPAKFEVYSEEGSRGISIYDVTCRGGESRNCSKRADGEQDEKVTSLLEREKQKRSKDFKIKTARKGFSLNYLQYSQ